MEVLVDSFNCRIMGRMPVAGNVFESSSPSMSHGKPIANNKVQACISNGLSLNFIENEPKEHGRKWNPNLDTRREAYWNGLERKSQRKTCHQLVEKPQKGKKAACASVSDRIPNPISASHSTGPGQRIYGP